MKKYQKLLIKMRRWYANGQWHTFTLRHKSHALRCLNRYAEQLKRWGYKPIVTKVCIATLITSTLDLNGQQFIPSPDKTPFGIFSVGTESNPVFVDIDDDGDLDAFVGNNDGYLYFFRNTGSPKTPAFSFETDTPFGIDVYGNGSYISPEFVDIDADGDLDCFIGTSADDIRFFENSGSSSAPAFIEQSMHALSSIELSYEEKCAFADIDGDGDYDVFIGQYYGYTYFLENSGTRTAAAFSSPILQPFGLVDLEDYSLPELFDIDRDGDLDCFIGDNSGSIFFFENTGSSTMPAFADSLRNPFGIQAVSDYARPSFADIDADGDIDLFVGSGDGYTYFFPGSEGTAAFMLSSLSEPFGISNLEDYPAPDFVDIDGDGDLDAFLGEDGGNIFFFENTGNITSPAFADSVRNAFGIEKVVRYSVPELVDIDGDDDFDLFVGDSSGIFNYFENTGSPTSPAFSLSTDSEPFGLLDTIDFSYPRFVDIDGDGDLDVFTGEEFDALIFFENTGDPQNPAFSLSASSAPFGLVAPDDYTVPSFVDMDGDGDFDAFLTDGQGYTYFFENTGNRTNPTFLQSSSSDPFGLEYIENYTIHAFIDIDGDGDFDVFSGVDGGETYFFENKPCRENSQINHAQLGQSFFQTDVEIKSAALLRKRRVVEFQSLQFTLDPKFEVAQDAQLDLFIGGCEFD